jgi:hypothetical protein
LINDFYTDMLGVTFVGFEGDRFENINTDACKAGPATELVFVKPILSVDLTSNNRNPPTIVEAFLADNLVGTKTFDTPFVNIEVARGFDRIVITADDSFCFDFFSFTSLSIDLCPNDPHKVDVGLCGCGIPDTDTDGDGIADCNEMMERNGKAQGDPHFKTWQGHHFDFHGVCDLILLQSKEFESGLGLDVHIRTHIRRDMSYISSAALRIGTDVLEVESQGVYYLNGVADADLPSEFGGFEFLHTQPTDKQHVFEVHLGVRERIKVKTYKDLSRSCLSRHRASILPTVLASWEISVWAT